MGMSEKEWNSLARERGLDPGTGAKLQEPPPNSAGSFDIETHTLLRHIRDEIKMLVTINGVGFVVLLVAIAFHR